MSIGCISVQPSSVQVLERLPGDGEEPKRSQPPKRYISSACPPIGSNWTRCDIVSDLTGNNSKKIKLCKVPQKVFPANVSRYWLVLYLSLQKGTLLLQILTDPYLAIHLTPHNDPGKNACTTQYYHAHNILLKIYSTAYCLTSDDNMNKTNKKCLIMIGLL